MNEFICFNLNNLNNLNNNSKYDVFASSSSPSTFEKRKQAEVLDERNEKREGKKPELNSSFTMLVSKK